MLSKNKFFLCATSAFLCSSFLIASPNRSWENWDDPGVAIAIDTFWNSSPYESKHRELLANLVCEFFSPGDRFLEVGSGTGLVYERLAPKVDNYIGIDISKNMLEIAKKRFPAANFFEGDVFDLPFSENSFDIVCAFEVLCHLGDIQIPIREMFRVASKFVIFTAWTDSKTVTTEERILNSTFIHRSYAHADIIDIIHRAGLKSYSIAAIPLMGGFTAYIVKKEKF